ncbi:DNA topoisomerase [Geobacillus stearothermophilus]
MAGCSKKRIKRFWTSSLTENAIRKGFAELKDGKETIHLFHEAQARQIADWLVGMNASRLYTLLLQQKGIRDVFSVGRVQTPVLKLIYDRQKEIEHFRPEPFYELEGQFTVKNGTYRGKLNKRFSSPDELYEAVRPDITKEQQTYQAVIKSVRISEKRTPAPKLHSLSTLQSKLNRTKKFSPTKVLELVQSLYEKGYVSYPRTDSQYITEEEYTYLQKHVDQYQQCLGIHVPIRSLQPSKRYVNPEKVSDHYAIIPTEKVPDTKAFETFSSDEKEVYYEILKSALAMFMTDYVYDETVIITSVGKQEFVTKGRTEKEMGWKALYQNEKDEESEGEQVAFCGKPTIFCNRHKTNVYMGSFLVFMNHRISNVLFSIFFYEKLIGRFKKSLFFFFREIVKILRIRRHKKTGHFHRIFPNGFASCHPFLNHFVDLLAVINRTRIDQIVI